MAQMHHTHLPTQCLLWQWVLFHLQRETRTVNQVRMILLQRDCSKLYVEWYMESTLPMQGTWEMKMCLRHIIFLSAQSSFQSWFLIKSGNLTVAKNYCLVAFIMVLLDHLVGKKTAWGACLHKSVLPGNIPNWDYSYQTYKFSSSSSELEWGCEWRGCEEVVKIYSNVLQFDMFLDVSYSFPLRLKADRRSPTC